MKSELPIFQIKPEIVRAAMLRKGYKSIDNLSAALGLHRNTVGNYLRGAPAFSPALNSLLQFLDLNPNEVFEQVRPKKRIHWLAICELVSGLHRRHSAAAYVLFGSRARGAHKRFSDYDLGFFSSKEIKFQDFSELLSLVDEHNDQSLSTAQLTNLNVADSSFLREIQDDLLFIAGDPQAWLDLLAKAEYYLYE